MSIAGADGGAGADSIEEGVDEIEEGAPGLTALSANAASSPRRARAEVQRGAGLVQRRLRDVRASRGLAQRKKGDDGAGRGAGAGVQEGLREAGGEEEY